jgi:hypothetical protein
MRQKTSNGQLMIFRFMPTPSSILLLIVFVLVSPNYSIRPRQHIWRDHQTDLLCRPEVNDKLELRRLLHWNVGLLRLHGLANRKEQGAKRDANDLVHEFISSFVSTLCSMPLLHAIL